MFNQLKVNLWILGFKFINLEKTNLMKVLIVMFLLLLSSCSIYNRKEHSPSVLFSTENLNQQPSIWKYYLHDPSSGSFETVSASIRENTLEIVPVKKRELEVPESLSRTELSRKNEIHVYVKEADLLIGIPIKLKEENIEKVVTYVHPDDYIKKKEIDKKYTKVITWIWVIVLVALAGFAGALAWLYYLFQ